MNNNSARCSIAMTTHNSERFLSEQIDSILLAMGENDELVISDDASTDATISIIKKYMASESRIRLIKGTENVGFNVNAERAYANCNGSYIFHSDDDNVWNPEKINVVLQAFKEHPKAILVMHDATIVDEQLNKLAPSFQKWRKAKPGVFHNIIRLGYGGSLLAFRRDLLAYLLPFPADMPFFADAWVGFMADKHFKSCFIPDVLSCWRRHGSNASGDNGLSSSGQLTHKTSKAKRLINAFKDRLRIIKFLKKH